MSTTRRERDVIVRSHCELNCSGRPLKLNVSRHLTFEIRGPSAYGKLLAITICRSDTGLDLLARLR